MNPTFTRQYWQDVLRTLDYLTREVANWADAPKEPLHAPAEELRLFRLQALLKQMRCIVGRAFVELPSSFRRTAGIEEDEWMQEAMIQVVELTKAYDDSKGVPYQKYMVKFLKWRLLNRQKTVCSKHPPKNPDLVKQVEQLAKELGRELTPQEIAKHFGSDVWSTQEALGHAVFVSIEEHVQIEDQTQRSPHQEFLLNCLLQCLETFDLITRNLFIRHEFRNESFPALYDEFGPALGSSSKRSFERHYHDHVFDAIKECAQAQANSSVSSNQAA